MSKHATHKSSSLARTWHSRLAWGSVCSGVAVAGGPSHAFTTCTCPSPSAQYSGVCTLGHAFCIVAQIRGPTEASARSQHMRALLRI